VYCDATAVMRNDPRIYHVRVAVHFGRYFYKVIIMYISSFV
jgi:hypothetical protein